MPLNVRMATVFVILFCCATLNAQSQNNIFADTYYDFIQSRAWTYEEVAVDWKMDPQLQADFNEAFNNLLEDNAGAAEIGFTEVLKKDSLFWQAYYFRAAAYKYQRQLDKAEIDILFSRAWDDRPIYPLVFSYTPTRPVSLY